MSNRDAYAVLVQDGLITRVDEYRTMEQALAAAGPRAG